MDDVHTTGCCYMRDFLTKDVEDERVYKVSRRHWTKVLEILELKIIGGWESSCGKYHIALSSVNICLKV